MPTTGGFVGTNKSLFINNVSLGAEVPLVSAQHGRQTDELHNTVRSFNPDHNFRRDSGFCDGLGFSSRSVSFAATGCCSQFENERASRVSTISFGSCARYAGYGAAICAASLTAAAQAEQG